MMKLIVDTALTPAPLPEGEGFILSPLPMGEADAQERGG